MIPRPATSDYSDYFQGYVDRAPDGDVLAELEAQGQRMQLLLGKTTDQQGNHSYAPGKWSVKRVVQHVIDGERLFGYRAMCIARGDEQPLPSFDENAYAQHDGSATRSIHSLAEEYATVRASTVTMYRGFDGAAWQRRGTASGETVTTAALPWITLGHDLHHCAVLLERYGLQV